MDDDAWSFERKEQVKAFKELVESLSYWQRRADTNQCVVIVLKDRRGSLYGIYDGEKEPEHWGPCEILCRITPREPISSPAEEA